MLNECFPTEIFIFKYSPTWKQLKCPSVGKLMNQMYDQYKEGASREFKKNPLSKNTLHVKIWMTLKEIMLNRKPRHTHTNAWV